jgi:hypothetical protein
LHNSILLRFGWLNLLILSAVIGTVLTACADEKEADYAQVLPRTLDAGDKLPAALGETVLTLSGGTVGSTPINVDTALLESLGTVKYSVNDPYENKPIEYEGILLTTLLDQFGKASSSEIVITAIDDYQQNIPRTDAEKWPIILALKVDGVYAARDHRGPSMIIYPYDNYSELEPTTYDPFWVWQIANISFK